MANKELGFSVQLNIKEDYCKKAIESEKCPNCCKEISVLVSDKRICEFLDETGRCTRWKNKMSVQCDAFPLRIEKNKPGISLLNRPMFNVRVARYDRWKCPAIREFDRELKKLAEWLRNAIREQKSDKIETKHFELDIEF